MSAIYGLIGEADANLLEAMGSRLRHRGRTTLEWSFSPRVWLGQRLHRAVAPRLATETLALVADADLYNADELRELLARRGRRFETELDEEVILHAYAEFGPECCRRFNGEFALAVWDSGREVLVLARDPSGARPLYVWQGNGRVIFASEYKALLALEEVSAIPDLGAVQYLQHTKYAPPDRTLLRDIGSVPAGHWVEHSNREHRAHRYWDLSIDPVPWSEERLAKGLRDELLRAVERRIRGLTAVGASVSGIDSAAVVGAVRRVSPDLPLHTFTAGYGPEDPEMQSGALVARHLGTTHHEVMVGPERIPGVLPQIIWHLEDPIARSEIVLGYEMVKEAAEHVEVVVGGETADSLFAGMPKYKLIQLMRWLPWLKGPLEEFYHYTQFSVAPRSITGNALKGIYFRGPEPSPPAVRGASPLPAPEPLPPVGPEMLNQVLRRTVLEKSAKWLPKVDRLHFAHGVRFSSPFMDVELIRYAFRIPDRYKIRLWREKHILREAVRPLLPPELVKRPKFPQRMNYDLAFSETLEGMVNEVLYPVAVRTRGFFEVSEMERLRRRPLGEPYSDGQAMRLWTALVTELWARAFLDRRGAPPEPQAEEAMIAAAVPASS